MADSRLLEHDRLHIMGGGQKVTVADLYGAPRDENFIPKSIAVARTVTEFVRGHLQHEPDLNTALTRGGIPSLEALRQVFPTKSAELIFAGQWREHVARHLPESLYSTDQPTLSERKLLALGDLIIASGGSIVSVLQDINRLTQGNQFQEFAVVAPIVTELGIKTILDAFPNVHIFTAYLEEETQWVTFPDVGGKKGKTVLFIGGPGELGDMGDQVRASADEILKTNPSYITDSTILRVLSQLR